MGTLLSEGVWCPWNDIIVCESKTNTFLEWLDIHCMALLDLHCKT